MSFSKSSIKFAVLFALIASLTTPLFAANGTLPGNGTEESPYLIEDFSDLETFADPCYATTYWAPGVYTSLVADIDLNPSLPGRKVYDKAVIGKSVNNDIPNYYIYLFRGHFNGNNHYVSNMTIVHETTPYQFSDIGFFSNTFDRFMDNHTSIENLHLRNISITVNHNGGSYDNIGGLVGSADYAYFDHCSVTGSITVTPTDYKSSYIGLFCGVDNGIITNCYAKGSINADHAKIGGFAAYNYQSFLDSTSNCFVDVDLSNCSAAQNSQNEYVRGFGSNYNLTYYPSIFWNRDTAGIEFDPDDTSALTTAQMQTQSTFVNAGWDFSDSDGNPAVWAMSPVTGFPIHANCLSDIDSFEPDNSPQEAYVHILNNMPQTHSLSPVGDIDWTTFDITQTEDISIVINANSPHPLEMTLYNDQMEIITENENIIESDNTELTLNEGKYYLNISSPNNQILSYSVIISPKHYSGGAGTDKFPYLLSTPEDIILLGETPTDYDKHFQLIADIDFTDHSFTNSLIAADSNTDSGFQGNFFAGTINGNGHTISNLTITPTETSNEYIGFIAATTETSVFKNINISNALISTSDSLGLSGLLCSHNRGQISNCNVQGQITAGQSAVTAGGLCGGNEGEIIYSAASVNITSGPGSVYIGGFVSYNNGTINNCYTTGNISGSQFVGAFAGHVAGSIENCYSIGSVLASSDFGPFCGILDGGSIQSSFWDVNTSGIGSSGDNNFGAIGKTTAEMQTQSTFTNAGWDFTETDGNSAIWTMPDTTGYPVLINTTSNTGQLYSGGEGTIQSPYQLSTPEDIILLGQRTDDYNKYFELTNDIDFTNFTFTNSIIAADSNPDSGYQGTFFAGIIDGKGHTISNLSITPNATIKDYIGLIAATTDTSVLKNITLQNVSISTNDSIGLAGALCSHNRGQILSCSAQGQIIIGQSAVTVGGLCGGNHGTIRSSFSSVNITAGQGSLYIGALASYSNGIIQNCYATGDITGSEYVGGLVGHVSGSVMNCYSIGTVTATANKGPLCGYLEGGSVQNSFWDVNTSGFGQSGDTHNDAIGKTTAEMQTLTTFTDAGWDMTTDDSNNATWLMPTPPGYPILHLLQDDSSVFMYQDMYEGNNSITSATPMTLSDLTQYHTIAPIGDVDWITFTLENDTNTIISTTTIIGDTQMWLYDSEQNEIAFDDNSGQGDCAKIKHQLPAGTYFVKITEAGNDSIILPYTLHLYQTSYSGGSGSESDPFLIATPQDLINVGQRKADYNKYFRQTAHIDMSDYTFDQAIIAPDEIFSENEYWIFDGTEFNGHYDGQGFTIANTHIEGDSFCALFGQIGPDATLANTNLTNFDHRGTSFGNAGLCGWNNGGTITHCSITGAVYASGESALVTVVNVGTIQHSYAEFIHSVTDLTNYACSSFCLYNQGNGLIDSCYAMSEDIYPFHFINANDGVVTNCINTNSPIGSGTKDMAQVQSNIESAGWNFTPVYNGESFWFMSPINGFPMLAHLNTDSTDHYESDNASTQATTITLNDTIMQHHSIAPVSDVDWFTFTLDQSENIFINTYGISGDNTMTLYDNQLNQLAFDDNSADDQFASIIISLDSGTYFIKVQENGNDQTIPYYTIRLETQRYSGGCGTSSNPFQLSTVDDLNALSSNILDYTKHFILTNDIDLSGHTYPAAVIAPDLDQTNDFMIDNYFFNGSFDGNGHSIDNMTIECTTNGGFFSAIGQNAKVSNLILNNASVQGNIYLAPLAAFNHYGEITNSAANATMDGQSYTAGFVAANVDGTITNCYANTTFMNAANGFIAHNNNINSLISNCYLAANKGLFIGDSENVMPQNCFWNAETSEDSNSGDTNFGATGLTTAQMQDVNTFLNAGWDFNAESANGTADIWHMPYNGTGYPMLYYQRDIPGDLTGQYGVDMDDFAALTGDWQIENMSTLLDIATHWLAGM